MNREILIRPEAVEELLFSARWYEERQPGLGADLIDEAWAALERVRAMPTAFGRHQFYRGSAEIRRAGLARFPYGVIFLVEADCIVVLAFVPDRRRPLYWLDRLRNSGD